MTDSEDSDFVTVRPKRGKTEGAKHHWTKARVSSDVVRCRVCGLERATSRGKSKGIFGADVVTTYRYPDGDGQWLRKRPPCKTEQGELFSCARYEEHPVMTAVLGPPVARASRAGSGSASLAGGPAPYQPQPRGTFETVSVLSSGCSVTFTIDADGDWFGSEEEWSIFTHGTPLAQRMKVTKSTTTRKVDAIAEEMRKLVPCVDGRYVIAQRVRDGALRIWTAKSGEWVFRTKGEL